MANIICAKCGSQVTLPEGITNGFCGTCGEPASAAENAAPVVNYTEPAPAVSYADPAPAGSFDNPAVFNAPKKGFPVKLVIIVVAALVVIAAAAYFVLPMLTGSSYEKAEAAFFTQAFSQLSAAGTSDSAGSKTDFTVKYKTSDDTEFIGDLTLAGTIAQFQQAILADITIATADDSLQTIASYDAEGLTVSMPSINDYFLRQALLGDETDMSELDMKALADSLTAIMKEYFAITKDITVIEKGVELSVGSVAAKCDKYTIEFTYEMFDRLIRFALDEARSNENLLEFIATTMGEDYDAYDVEDMIDDFEDDLDYIDADDDERLFRMSVWVKGNEIVAREFDKIYELSGVKFTYQFLKNNKTASLNITAKGIDGVTTSIKGDFTNSGSGWDGTLKGSLKVDSYYGTDVNLNVKLSSVQTSKDITTGDIRITLSGVVEGDDINVSLRLALSDSGGKQVIGISGAYEDYYNSIDLGSLTISYAMSEIKSLKLPSYDEDYVLIFNDYSDENIEKIEAFMDDFDIYEIYDMFEEGSVLAELAYSLYQPIMSIVYWSSYSY